MSTMQIQKSGRIKILLALFFVWLFLSVEGYAQAVAYYPPLTNEQRIKKDSTRKQKKEYERLLEQRERDSLRQLLDSGKADTIRYEYYDKWGILSAKPRTDLIDNRIADNTGSISWILLLLTILIIYFCSKLFIKNLYKEKPDYLFPYIAVYLLGGCYVYLTLSCLYRNLDDMMIRKYGEEKMAVLDNDSIRYTYFSWYRDKVDSRENYFIFTNLEGVRLGVNVGNTKFDRDNHQAVGKDTFVKVRYDSAAHKLSVDDHQYFMQNLNMILLMCLLIVLFLLFSFGKFNWLFNSIDRRMKKHIENNHRKMLDKLDFEPSKLRGYQLYSGENDLVYFYWTFTSNTYVSINQFCSEVKHFQDQQELDDDEKLNPYREIPELTGVSVTVSDDEIVGENDLIIEIRSDNGRNLTEGEFFFKLHHQMIPYLDRLVTRSIFGLSIFGNWRGEELVECTILFDFDDGIDDSKDDDDIVD